MSMIGDSTLTLLQAGLDVSLARQNTITANVANLDTPGFTPSDVDFATALQDAVEGSKLRMSRADGGHRAGMAERGSADQRVAIIEQGDVEPGRDGNSVDLDAQMARLSQNGIFYQAQTRIVSKKLAMYRYIVSEGAF